MAQDKNLQELQSIEQNMQSIALQKQNVQMQVSEIESALKEIEGKESAYKIIGTILVETKTSVLTEDLKSKLEIYQVRLKTLEKQEVRLRERFDQAQKGVLDGIRK